MNRVWKNSNTFTGSSGCGKLRQLASNLGRRNGRILQILLSIAEACSNNNSSIVVPIDSAFQYLSINAQLTHSAWEMYKKPNASVGFHSKRLKRNSLNAIVMAYSNSGKYPNPYFARADVKSFVFCSEHFADKDYMDIFSKHQEKPPYFTI